MVAQFEHFASGEYMSEHCQSLLSSKEMEFLYRLQVDECLRYSDRLVPFDRERPWLKQQRRTIDISNLGRQDETWTFEIDWSVVQGIAQDCGLGRLDEGELVPLPLLLIRRYVATDYMCASDGDGSYMTHRGANNAFAALIAAYFLSARYELSYHKKLPVGELNEIYHGWDHIFNLGGNLPTADRNAQIERSYADFDAFFWHLDDNYLISADSVAAWKDAANKEKDGDALGAIRHYEEDRSPNLREAEFKRILQAPNGPLLGGDCVHHNAAQQSAENLDDLKYRLSILFQYQNLLQQFKEHYPVLVFIPAQTSGRRTYQFTLSRYERLDGVRDEIHQINKAIDQETAPKPRPGTQSENKAGRIAGLKSCLASARAFVVKASRITLAMMLFREFNKPYIWLRSSTFLVHRFAKDVRPVFVRDHYEGDEQSIISDTELFTSLHMREHDDEEPEDAPERITYVSGLLIPRLRNIIPMVTFFAIQMVLLVLYASLTHLTTVTILSPSTTTATALPNTPAGILFRTMILAQLGVTFFIAPRDEGSTATRMLRIPRYSALSLLPFQLWMLYNVTCGNSQLSFIQYTNQHPKIVAGVTVGFAIAAAIAAVIAGMLIRPEMGWLRKIAIIVLSVIAASCAFCAANNADGLIILPFFCASALCVILGFWLLIYGVLRLIAPQNLPNQ